MLDENKLLSSDEIHSNSVWKLGLTYVKIKAINLMKPELKTELDLLVDTGSTLTWMPRKTLEALSVEPRGIRQFKTIEGKSIRRETGLVVVEYEGLEAVSEVVFAEETDGSVMGVTTLESLGFRVNPITGKLEYVGLLAI
jgi:predicted aspartyl protease